MPSSPLGSTHGRMTLCVACHHRPWTAHTVDNVRCGMTSPPLDCTHGRQRRAWHGIIAFGLANIVGRRRAWHAIIALGRKIWLNDVGRGMPSLPLGSIDGRTASCVACYRRLLPAHTVERRRAWHVIIAFGQHTQSNDVRRFMQSSPLEGKHGRTTFGVACNHRPLTANTVERRRASHAIIALGQHRRSVVVERAMPS